MRTLVCPTCKTENLALPTEDCVHCRSCGQRLSIAEDVQQVMVPADDDLLVAELREAFGPGSRGIKAPDPTQFQQAAQNSRDDASTERASAKPAHAGIPVGSQVGDFEIMSEIGRGGMGIVYRARQRSLDRDVALKILPGASFRSGQAVYRFRREALAAARLNHENVVPIYAQGEFEGHYYYAMKLVNGCGLDVAIRDRSELLSSTFVPKAPSPASWMRSFPAPQKGSDTTDDTPAQPVPEPAPIKRSAADYRLIATMMAGVAEGLGHAHDKGVLHRDVKPSNLLVGEEQRLYVADFGLAYLEDEPHVTVTGEVMGTPAYLAPEQISGSISDLDHRVDIYSMGVTLYELLTGRRPFTGDSRDQILHAICTAIPPTPRHHDRAIPVDLETICLRAMEREPSRRYPNAFALAEDLHRFSEGRHILSRRVGPVEKAVRWIAGHKTLSMAVMLAMAAGVTTAGWSWSARQTRIKEIQRLLGKTYEALVYRNYHYPQRVEQDMEQAASLGASGRRFHLLQALSYLGRYEEREAVPHMQAILDEDSGDVEALYLLAYLHWRLEDREAYQITFDQAEQLGGPTSAEGWFFRGLAVHRDDPDIAIDSYRQACLIRAADQAFFPQATLNLARAHNQRMYATRSIDSLSEADLYFRQLADQGHYGSAPYYFLSITHRLAGEIYRGSAGVRGDEQAGAHFDLALQWARDGQAHYPDSARPVTAEAECLEQLGLFADALAARDRAVALARTDFMRCESLHYRWRLHYWLGHLDEALEDIEEHATCMPDSLHYAHIYPALVLAEMGRIDEALDHARGIPNGQPPDLQAVIWSSSCLRLLGQGDEADQLLRAHAPELDSSNGSNATDEDTWRAALYALCMGKATLENLDELAAQAEKPWARRGEADFHAAVRALSLGNQDEAIELLDRSYRSFDGALGYSFHAKVILERIAIDPPWPDWNRLGQAGGREAQHEG